MKGGREPPRSCVLSLAPYTVLVRSLIDGTPSFCAEGEPTEGRTKESLDTVIERRP